MTGTLYFNRNDDLEEVIILKYENGAVSCEINLTSFLFMLSKIYVCKYSRKITVTKHYNRFVILIIFSVIT
jgi:hypothetical protein